MDSEIRKIEHSDAETGALHFDSGKFRQILDLAEKYPAREEGGARRIPAGGKYAVQQPDYPEAGGCGRVPHYLRGGRGLYRI